MWRARAGGTGARPGPPTRVSRPHSAPSFLQKENFLSSLQTREAAIKEDIAKDKTTKTQLEAHVKALTARVHLLQKHRLAMELRAQAQQYAAAQHTLEGQANSIKQVRRGIAPRRRRHSGVAHVCGGRWYLVVAPQIALSLFRLPPPPQVANSLSSRVAAVETETKPLQAEES